MREREGSAQPATSAHAKCLPLTSHCPGRPFHPCSFHASAATAITIHCSLLIERHIYPYFVALREILPFLFRYELYIIYKYSSPSFSCFLYRETCPCLSMPLRVETDIGETGEVPRDTHKNTTCFSFQIDRHEMPSPSFFCSPPSFLPCLLLHVPFQRVLFRHRHRERRPGV